MKKIIPYIATAFMAFAMYAFHAPINTASAAEYTLTPMQPNDLSPEIQRAKSASVSILIMKPVQQTRIIYGDAFPDDRSPDGFDVYVPIGYENATTTDIIGVGSGFIGTRDGRIITAKHVVDDPEAKYIVMLDDGTEKPATVEYKDPHNDIAIVKIDGEYPTIATLGDSALLEAGQDITAIGNAAQYGRSMSEGSIVGFDRDIEAIAYEDTTEHLSGLIETTAPMIPGYSGGPTLDANGVVIGMSIATDGESGRGYSIPINIVKRSIGAVRR